MCCHDMLLSKPEKKTPAKSVGSDDIVFLVLRLQDTNMSLYSLHGVCIGFAVLLNRDEAHENFAFWQSP